MGDNGYRGEGWFWKPIALITVSSLITGSGFFIKESIAKKDFVTRAETQAIIKNESPYLHDRKFILSTLEKIQIDVDFIKQHFWKSINND